MGSYLLEDCGDLVGGEVELATGMINDDHGTVGKATVGEGDFADETAGDDGIGEGLWLPHRRPPCNHTPTLPSRPPCLPRNG